MTTFMQGLVFGLGVVGMVVGGFAQIAAVVSSVKANNPAQLGMAIFMLCAQALMVGGATVMGMCR